MSTGLRERKKAETRQALSRAALRLAERLGPDGVTVEAIAERAGVSPRTFFNYFSSKDDAIAGVSTDEPSELLEHLVARPDAEDPGEALREALRTTASSLEGQAADWASRNRLVQRFPQLAVRRAARLTEVERSVVVEVARRMDLDPDRDLAPGVLVAATLGAARVAMTVWEQRAHPGDLADLFDEAFDRLG